MEGNSNLSVSQKILNQSIQKENTIQINQTLPFQNNYYQGTFNQGIFIPNLSFQYIFFLNHILYPNIILSQLLKSKKNEKNDKLKNEKEEKKNEEVENDNNILLNKKKKRNSKLCTNCPHKFSPHYAKGMCSNCYHSKGRSKKPWNCSHINKTHYALGLCQNCYQMAYIKKQSQNDNNKFISVNFKKNENEKNNQCDNDVIQF